MLISHNPTRRKRLESYSRAEAGSRPAFRLSARLAAASRIARLAPPIVQAPRTARERRVRISPARIGWWSQLHHSSTIAASASHRRTRRRASSIARSTDALRSHVPDSAHAVISVGASTTAPAAAWNVATVRLSRDNPQLGIRRFRDHHRSTGRIRRRSVVEARRLVSSPVSLHGEIAPR